MATAESDIQNKLRKDKESSEENSENYQEILDENVSAERENIKAEQIKLSSEEDLVSLLKLAEDLKEKIENPAAFRQILLFRTIQILFIIPFLFELYSIVFQGNFATTELFKSSPNKTFFLTMFVSLYVLPIFFLIFAEFSIRKIKNERIPDKLALKEVLQLLREVHGTIAEREDWSILKRAEFRIRLSRFDLSEKKESVFSFFS